MVRRSPSRVFLPWERPGGLTAILGRARAPLLVGVGLGLVALVLIWQREEHDAAVRATRATLTTAMRAVFAYRADHQGQCPSDWNDLMAGGYARDVFVDAWGRPLRLRCPGRKNPRWFDLSSDGPDGLPGGLDRVE